MKNEKKIAYKGFDKDLKCRGFQYEVGKDYDLPEDPVLCKSGFHACDNPLAVLQYYHPCDDVGNIQRYCQVEQGGIIVEGEDKTASSKIHIACEIGLEGLIDAGVKFILDRVKSSGKTPATNTGNYSAASVEGEDSVAIVTGSHSRAKGKIGCWLVLTERGDWDGTTYPILGIKAVKVDGKKILPDTFYALENGKIVKQ